MIFPHFLKNCEFRRPRFWKVWSKSASVHEENVQYYVDICLHAVSLKSPGLVSVLYSANKVPGTLRGPCTGPHYKVQTAHPCVFTIFRCQDIQ